MKRKFIVAIFLLTVLIINARADIPQQVIDLMQKSSASMDSPDGLQMDIIVHAKALFVTMNIDIKSYMKNDMYLMVMHSKILDEEIHTESGCDGQQSWTYKKLSNRADTLKIENKPKENNSEYNVDFDLYNDYENAKIKEKKGIYEITFTKPKSDDDTPDKTIMRIDASTYHPLEMEVKQSIMTMTLNFKNIRFGVADEIFVFDPQKYDGAVVIRE